MISALDSGFGSRRGKTCCILGQDNLLSLSTQVHKMGTDENARGNPAMDWPPIQGDVEILVVTSCYRKKAKLRPNCPLGSQANFTFFLPFLHFLAVGK